MGLSLMMIGIGGFTEACMRFSVEHGGWSRFANPGAYFDPTCEDHFWRLLHHSPGWDQALRIHSEHELDAQLGWGVDRRNENSWGAWESPLYPLRFDGDPIGFFGDSYVFGTTADGERLPDQLAELLPESRILNYGVAGYGFDQIVLSLEAQAERLAGHQALIGVLTNDLDRSVLSVRSGPKPYFTEEAGDLTVHTDHITSNEDYFAAHPVRPLSYLWTYLRINIPRHWNVWVKDESWNCELPQKERVNSALFSRLKATCESHNIACSVVLFHNPEHVNQAPDWRTELVHRETERVGIALLDTRLLTQEALSQQVHFYGSDRHPSPDGNRLLAEGIVAGLDLQIATDAHSPESVSTPSSSSVPSDSNSGVAGPEKNPREGM